MFSSVCSICVYWFLVVLCAANEDTSADEQLLWRPCNVYGCVNGAVCNRTSLECSCVEAAVESGSQCQTLGELCNEPCNKVGTVEGIDGVGCDHLTGECICKDDFYGSTCNTPRVRATCDDTSMIIKVTPFDYSDGSPFSGTIFGSPTDSFSALPVPCTFTGDDGRYEITLDYSSVNGDCGKPVDTVDDDGNTIKLFHFYVQHISRYQLYSDHKIRVTCQPAGTGDVVDAHISSVTVYDLTAERSTHAESDGVTMDLMHEDFAEYFTPITSPLSLADPVALIIQHNALFGIQRCVASDRLSGGKEMSLISNWCVPNCAAPLYRESIGHSLVTETRAEGGSGRNIVVRLPLQAWHFPGSSQVYITCDICLDESCALVEEPTCSENNLADLLIEKTHKSLSKGVKRPRRESCPKSRRRRRNVVESTKVIKRQSGSTALPISRKQNERSLKNPGRNRFDHNQVAQTSLTVSFLVSDPNDQNGVKSTPLITEEDTTMENCYQSMAVLLPMGTLIILLLITTLLTFHLCLQNSRNNYRWKIDEKLIQG